MIGKAMKNMMRIVLRRDFNWVGQVREVIREVGGVYEYAGNICGNIFVDNCDGADLELA